MRKQKEPGDPRPPHEGCRSVPDGLSQIELVHALLLELVVSGRRGKALCGGPPGPEFWFRPEVVTSHSQLSPSAGRRRAHGT